MMALVHCGLDFGTSNSTLGMVGQKLGAMAKPRMLALEADEITLPSILFYSFEDDSVSFGREAIAEYTEGVEGRLLRSLKSVLGTSLMGETTRIRQSRVSFSQIITRFVSELKKRADAQLDTPLDVAVLGRPVHFVDENPLADQEAQSQLETAVLNAGFSEVSFQFEPIAAALDYEQSITKEELALVVDIGGGTSDFTIIRLSPTGTTRDDRQADILATAGVHVGGTDFDQLLSFRMVMPQLGMGGKVRGSERLVPNGPYFDLATWHRINNLYTNSQITELRSTWREGTEPDKLKNMLTIVENQLGHALAGEVEQMKIALTSADSVLMDFKRSNVNLTADLTLGAFDKAIAPAADKIPDTINCVLALAGVSADKIDTVIMTGGSTQIPYVRKSLDAVLPQANFMQTDAFGSVGAGLALEAQRRYGS